MFLRRTLKTITIVCLLACGTLVAACVLVTAPASTPSAAIPSSGPPGAGAPGLIGETWQWEKQVVPSSSREAAIDNPANYTLTFDADGSYQFKADCNQGSGSYVADEKGAIRLTPGPMTMAVCGESSRDQDMLTMMQSVQDYRLEEDGGVLVMVWPAGGLEDFYRSGAQ